MPDGSLEVERQPMPSVNAPASGAYGEGAALTRLQDALPPMQKPAQSQPALPQVSQEPVRPTPPQREGRPPSGAALPPGVPSPILAPTNRPNVPASTPLAAGPSPAPAPTGAALRLQIVDLLAESPDVSEATRQWAQMVRRALLS